MKRSKKEKKKKPINRATIEFPALIYLVLLSGLGMLI